MSRFFGLGRISLAGFVAACTSAAPNSGVEAANENSETTSCEPKVMYEDFGALPSWMAAGGDYVYWIDEQSDSLFRQSKSGNEPEVVSANVAAWGAGIAADADAVFVGTRDGSVRRVPVDGSPEVVLAEIGGERASRLQILGDDLYWLAAGGQVNGRRVVADVRRVRKDVGGSSELLWSGATYGLALGAGYLFVEEYNLPITGAPEPNGVILRVSSAGEATTLAADLLIPQVQAADDSFVYYTAQTHDAEREAQLWRVSVEGGAAELVHVGGLDYHVDVGQMIVDDGSVWWGQANDGLLIGIPEAGAQPASVAVTESPHTLGLAGDDERLYFSGSFSRDAVGPGTIWQVGRGCPID